MSKIVRPEEVPGLEFDDLLDLATLTYKATGKEDFLIEIPKTVTEVFFYEQIFHFRTLCFTSE